MSEFQTPNGKVTKVHVHEDGSTTPMTAKEIIAAVMADEIIMGVDEDGLLWADCDGLLVRVIDVEVEEVEERITMNTMNEDYLWMVDDKGKFRSWDDDDHIDYSADYKFPFQKGYVAQPGQPGSWL